MTSSGSDAPEPAPAAVAVDPARSLLPEWLPAFNRRVTNRVQGIYAPYLPPLAVVVHVGRRTGRVFTTPVAASRFDAKVAIPLPYSAEAHWVQNLLAADGGELIRRGQRFTLTAPRVITEPGAEPLPALLARAAAHMPVLVADLIEADA